VITPGSELERVRLSDARLNSKYGLNMLALYPHGQERKAITKQLQDMVLASGDVLLVKGSIDAINKIKSSRDLLILDGREELPYAKKTHWH
jgi:uncharacterized protein with PhoU and TrkA domain